MLQRATKADVRSAPYPHIVFKDALPDDFYRDFGASFPKPETLTGAGAENNKRWNYLAWRIKANPGRRNCGATPSPIAPTGPIRA